MLISEKVSTSWLTLEYVTQTKPTADYATPILRVGDPEIKKILKICSLISWYSNIDSIDSPLLKGNGFTKSKAGISWPTNKNKSPTQTTNYQIEHGHWELRVIWISSVVLHYTQIL